MLLLIVASIFIVGCESDPGGGTDFELGPSVTLHSDAALTMAPEAKFVIDFSATPGDNKLNAFTVYEDGVKVPASRLLVDGTQPGDAAVLLFDSDIDGITNKMVTITAQSAAATTASYEIKVVDKINKSESIFVDVTTVGEPPVFSVGEPTIFDGAEQNTKIAVKLTASSGSGTLANISVLENDVLLDASRIGFSNYTITDNPFPLEGDDVNGFEDATLFITSADSEGTFIYDIIITDEFGLNSTDQYTIITKSDVVLTPIDLLTGILLNSAGPSGTGGLDLDTGNSTGSSDAAAEIKDNGINGNSTATNWIQTISGVNGSVVKYLRPGMNGLSESFTFGGLEFKEDIASLFDNGIAFSDNTSEVINTGDMLVVQNSGKTWILRVMEVNVKTMGNSDNYVFSVKF